MGNIVNQSRSLQLIFFISKINFDLDFFVLFIIEMMGLTVIYEMLIIQLYCCWQVKQTFQGKKMDLQIFN